jgi:hypothetical protein
VLARLRQEDQQQDENNRVNRVEGSGKGHDRNRQGYWGRDMGQDIDLPLS